MSSSLVSAFTAKIPMAVLIVAASKKSWRPMTLSQTVPHRRFLVIIHSRNSQWCIPCLSRLLLVDLDRFHYLVQSQSLQAKWLGLILFEFWVSRDLITARLIH
jgi:hypothetical protein